MDSVHIHLMLNHIPVLGTLFGMAIFLLGFFRKNEEVQRVSLYVFIFSALMAIPVYLTGEPAEEAVEHLAGVSESLIETHEDMAKISLFLIELLGISALINVVLSFKQQMLPKWGPPLILALSFATGGMMTYTAYLGGQIRHSEIRSGATPASGEKEGDKDDDDKGHPSALPNKSNVDKDDKHDRDKDDDHKKTPNTSEEHTDKENHNNHDKDKDDD